MLALPPPRGLRAERDQPPLPQRSLNCNTACSEEPDMLRTALGESTASLDSTVRSGPAAPSLSPGLGVAQLSEPAQACSSPFQAGWGGPWPCVWLSSWCCFPCPRGAACLPGRRRSAHLPHCSRDEGDQKLSVSSGPARGGHGEPDLPFVPKSTKKPHGTCPPEVVSYLPTLLPPRGLWVAASPWSLSVCPTARIHWRTSSFGEVSAAISPSENQ